MDASASSEGAGSPARKWGLALGGVVFILMLLVPAPGGLTPVGWRTAAVATLMAVWWITEAIPIPATALLPLVLFPVLGILSMPDAASPYANELIFLFMGGFLLAMAMERWGLHRRVALNIVARVGTSPGRVILGFMLATAFLSMWISNTATTTMMFPIALAVAEMFRHPEQGEEVPYNFGISLMLALAYAASIGGVATLIGTPPNAIMAGAASELLGIEIGFVQWMGVGLPVTIFMIPVTWFVLTRVAYPPGELAGDAGEVIERELAGLGRANRGERIVGAVFVITALAWLMRSSKTFGSVTIPGLESFAPELRDSTIAMLAAMVLFVAPVDWRRGVYALDWPTARRLPWGVLILFGGGLSLARAMDESGLAAWIGEGVAGLEIAPVILVALVAALFVFLTEVTSNAATSTMAMPIMAGAAVGLGIEPLTLMVTAGLAASMAFMLPVATPPNAIVFGSEYLTVGRMVRAGILMNFLSIVVVALAATLLLPVFL